jgi:hypothetical protein
MEVNGQFQVHLPYSERKDPWYLLDRNLRGDWVGSSASLDMVKRKEILFLVGIEPWFSNS